MKVIKGLKQGGTYKKRLRELGFFSLRRLREDLIAAYSYLMKGYREVEPDFSVVHSRRMRHKGHK